MAGSIANENTPTKPFQADSEVIDDLIKDLNTLRAVGFFRMTQQKKI